jgi:nicotinamidase-related amidase
MMDVQVGLVELMPSEIQRNVLPRIGTLLAKARASGALVIYIQHDGQSPPSGNKLLCGQNDSILCEPQ